MAETEKCKQCKGSGVLRCFYRDVEDYDYNGDPIYIPRVITKKCSCALARARGQEQEKT